MSRSGLDELASLSDILPDLNKKQTPEKENDDFSDGEASQNKLIMHSLKLLQEQMAEVNKRVNKKKRKATCTSSSDETSDARPNRRLRLKATSSSAGTDETPTKRRKVNKEKGVSVDSRSKAFDRKTVSTVTSKRLSKSTHPKCPLDTPHLRSANTEHLRSAITEHQRSATIEHQRSAKPEHLRSAVSTEHQRSAVTKHPRSAIGKPPININIKHSVTDNAGDNDDTVDPNVDPNLYDRLTLLPSDDNLIDDEDDSDHASADNINLNNAPNIIQIQNDNTGDNDNNIYNTVELPFDLEIQGAAVNQQWANMLTQTWDKKYTFHRLKPVYDRYPTPENLSENLHAPLMNKEISDTFQPWQSKNDKHMCGMQKSLLRCVTATLQLNETIAGSTVDDGKKSESLQTCIDVTAMCSQISRELSLKRRTFAKSVILPEYKTLCSSERPITKFLFGDNMTEDMKQIKIARQLTTKNTHGFQHTQYRPAHNPGSRGNFLGQGRGRHNNPGYQYPRRAPPNYGYQAPRSQRNYRKRPYRK